MFVVKPERFTENVRLLQSIYIYIKEFAFEVLLSTSEVNVSFKMTSITLKTGK